MASDGLREIRVENWHRNHMALSEAATWVIEHFTDETGQRPLPACLVALEASLG